MLCAICNTRRPRRYCPGVHGDICAICCGTEREVTVSCPLDCEYLQESRLRDKPPLRDEAEFPNRDIRVSEEFLRDHEAILIVLAAAVANAALATPGTTDSDLKEALEALVRTYRALQSGLIYEAHPSNPLAARICDAVQEKLADLRERIAKSGAIKSVRDSEILGIVVFLQRLEMQHNNGRPKSRGFIDFLRQFFPPELAKSLIA